MNEEDEAFNEIERKAKQRMEAVRAVLESQEPVAYINVEKRTLEWAKLTSWETPTVVNLPKISLYTHPPQRTWVGLTDEEIWTVLQFRGYNTDTIEIAQAIEAKLKEKNT